MSKVRVAGFTVSIDGYGAGPDQSLDDPLGRGGEAMHAWLTGTRMFHAMVGEPGGSTGVDDELADRSIAGFGAFIMGRNMFGPVRGEWPDASWRGWWGEDPPYHAPVFVLTHFEHPSIEMAGGTVFHFVTDGIEAALDRARETAGDLDVKIAGGVSTVRQYLVAGLVDELHLAISPVVLGRGEALLEGIDLLQLGFRVTGRVTTTDAVHVTLARG